MFLLVELPWPATKWRLVIHYCQGFLIDLLEVIIVTGWRGFLYLRLHTLAVPFTIKISQFLIAL